MTGDATSAHEPASHYNAVVGAWRYLLLEDLHYGYFETGAEPLIIATDALTDRMLALAELKTGNHVLDIGCGTGKAACRIAEAINCHVKGISPSVRCVSDATAKAAEQNLESLVQFCIGDGMAPDFPNGSFDCVWVMESSHLMRDKPALIRECTRVLRPGGRLVLCDVMLDHKLSFQESIRYCRDLLLLKDVFGEGAMEPLNFYVEQCELNGLIVKHSRDISAETQPTFDRWNSNAIENRTTVTEMIGEDAYQQFVDSCDVLRKLWKSRILGYGIISAHKAA